MLSQYLSHISQTRILFFYLQKKLFLEVIYNEPRDSKLYTQPGIDPDDSLKYKLYVGNESFYCKPLGCQNQANPPNYEQIQSSGKIVCQYWMRFIVV